MDPDAGPARVRRWDKLLWIGLGCWVAGFWWHWARPSLWLLDLVLVPVAAVLYCVGFVVAIVAAIGSGRRQLAVALVPVIVVATVLVNPMWRMAPRTWFLVHRPLFDLALATEPGDDYYGTKLPLPLQFLTVDGRVSSPLADDGPSDGVIRFFPQWIGIPDDAGGYLYSPNGSPAGVDLYGMFCSDPVDLGGGWWMCGMSTVGI